MKFINLAVVRFSIFLVIGILTAHYFFISFLVLELLVFLLCTSTVLWLITRKQLLQQPYFGVTIYFCFFLIGFFTYQIRLPHFQKDHYSHFVERNQSELVQIKIIQSLKPDSYNFKYFADVIAVNGKPSKGKILVNVTKDSLHKSFHPDEVLLVHAPISTIQKPLNPYQFDYSKYMESQGVYGQFRISKKDILRRGQGGRTLFGTAQNIRSAIVERLQKANLKNDERAIIQALILGEKKDIDKNLYQDYAAAGAVHILAVSGLHVGILYVILLFIFSPLRRLRYGIIFTSICIIFLLWGFAMLSGLSPSVTRAVTMFSFFAFAKLIDRDTNAINTLFLSLLTLLIINPLWIFQVGFQLSYLAVFFIVWLQPLFYNIGYSKYWIIRKVWGIASVTLAAQIGVMPLTLYYFHQFPGLFIITNIVVLPFLTVLMFGGILIVILAYINRLPHWLSEIYNAMIERLNNFIHWIAAQEEFLFKEIHFSTLKVLGTYFVIATCILFFRNTNYRRLVVLLLSVLLLIGIFIYGKFETASNHLLIFHKSGQTLIGQKRDNKLILYTNGSTPNIFDSYPIKSYKTAMNISDYCEEKVPSIFRYNQKNILLLNEEGVYPNGKNIHTIILSESPKVNLNRLIDSLQPKQIIADGTNYYSYLKRWEKTCKLRKLPFISTAEQGAFQIE